jgi:hypothetical protein
MVIDNVRYRNPTSLIFSNYEEHVMPPNLTGDQAFLSSIVLPYLKIKEKITQQVSIVSEGGKTDRPNFLAGTNLGADPGLEIAPLTDR